MESVWEYREETLYRRLFGDRNRGTFPLTADTFAAFNQHDIDPRWLFLGVLEFQPCGTRRSWLYVTSGGSNPWDTEPDDYSAEAYSGLGIEYVLETPTSCDWAVLALQRLLAYHVLVSHERFEGYTTPDYGYRIPAGGPLDNAASALRYFAVARPQHYANSAVLNSGRFDFLHVIGITETECDWARATSTEALIERLTKRGYAPMTSPARAELTDLS